MTTYPFTRALSTAPRIDANQLFSPQEWAARLHRARLTLLREIHDADRRRDHSRLRRAARSLWRLKPVS